MTTESHSFFDQVSKQIRDWLAAHRDASVDQITAASVVHAHTSGLAEKDTPRARAAALKAVSHAEAIFRQRTA